MKVKLAKIRFHEVNSDNEYQITIDLFKEYSSQLNIDLEFQNFNKELENISFEYSKPNGIIIIVYDNNKSPIGCAGVRKLNNTDCELKRMYLRKEYRGMGIGKKLLRKSIKKGKELGYLKMRLDTLSSMLKARDLYKKEGFYEIEAYRFNPIIGTKYYELILK